MAASAPAASRAELLIRTPDGKTRSVVLEGERYRLGRAVSNELCFPDITGLSREHVLFERSAAGWTVRDLGSTNGTFVNGTRIEGPRLLQPTDRVTAGILNLVFTQGVEPRTHTVEFVEDPSHLAASTTMIDSLHGLLAGDGGSQSGAHMKALIRAGRELSSHMPLGKLFELILSLSVEAAGAARGVLMTIEGGELQVRASRGDGFRISSTVRDLVILEKRSLLVRDALSDEALAGQASILQQQIRGILAAPLQTEDRVIGLIYLDSPTLLHDFSKEDLNLLTVMANIAAARLEQARLIEVEQAEKLRAKELEHAALIQRSILPNHFPPFPDRRDFELYASMIPAREVGGDLYDYFLLDRDRLGFVIGDVSGKGVPAALFMAVSGTLLRATAQHELSPGQCLTFVNKVLTEQNVSGMFVTIFYGILDTRTGAIEFANAGHNSPYVYRANGEFAELREKSGPMLGMIEELQYCTRTCRLEPGSGILLYTDGVTEATDRRGAFFDPKRLEQFLRERASEPPKQLALSLHRAVHDFSAGAPQADDITVLALRYLGPEGAGGAAHDKSITVV